MLPGSAIDILHRQDDGQYERKGILLDAQHADDLFLDNESAETAQLPNKELGMLVQEKCAAAQAKTAAAAVTSKRPWDNTVPSAAITSTAQDSHTQHAHKRASRAAEPTQQEAATTACGSAGLGASPVDGSSRQQQQAPSDSAQQMHATLASLGHSAADSSSLQHVQPGLASTRRLQDNLVECQSDSSRAHCSLPRTAVTAGQQALNRLMHRALGSTPGCMADTSPAATAASNSCGAPAEKHVDTQQAMSKLEQQLSTAGAFPAAAKAEAAAGIHAAVLSGEAVNEQQLQRQQQQPLYQQQQAAQMPCVQQKQSQQQGQSQQWDLTQQQQQQQPARVKSEVTCPRNTKQGVSFGAGQVIKHVCSSGSADKQKVLLLQVEHFIERGGNADVYLVKLLQQLLPGDASGQVSVEPAAAAAATDWSDMLQPGQRYALKVARRLESYPPEQQAGASAEAHLMTVSHFMLEIWQVLQGISKSKHIINAYSHGLVTPEAAFEAPFPSHEVPAVAAADTSGQQPQGQALTSGLSATAAAAAAAVAPLPCILTEYADGGSVQDSCDMVYKQHGKPTPLTARDAWQVTSAARFALKDLHAAGYIHRDVKVDNMLHIYRSGRAGTCSLTWALSTSSRGLLITCSTVK